MRSDTALAVHVHDLLIRQGSRGEFWLAYISESIKCRKLTFNLTVVTATFKIFTGLYLAGVEVDACQGYW